MRFVKHILLLLGIFTLLVTASPAAAVLTRSETRLLAAMNRARAAHGLAPLQTDATLTRAARAHSLDMLRRGYFAHGNFGARVHAFGARARFLGENLAWGSGSYGSAAHVVRMWLASPDHRANLLRPSFTRVGLAAPVGAFAGLPSVTVVTVDFGGH
jgi:uncharacterized protein YkwD